MPVARDGFADRDHDHPCDALIADSESIMMQPMRTTVTLDPETERLLREEMRRHGVSFKEALNRAVVRGLSETDRQEEAATPPPTVPMGLKAGYDPASMNRLADDLETDAFLTLTERLRTAGE